MFPELEIRDGAFCFDFVVDRSSWFLLSCIFLVPQYSLSYACLKLVNYSFFFWLPFYLSNSKLLLKCNNASVVKLCGMWLSLWCETSQTLISWPRLASTTLWNRWARCHFPHSCANKRHGRQCHELFCNSFQNFKVNQFMTTFQGRVQILSTCQQSYLSL